MTAKKLENLLDPAENTSKNGGLGELVRRARDMGKLTDTLSGALGAELAAGLVAASLRDDGTLVLLARSSSWASRLRFEEAAVLAAARSNAVNVDRVSVRVARVDYNDDG